MMNIEIRRLESTADADAFRSLNEEWITRHFVLEARDQEMLGDPEGTVIRNGGHIFLVHSDGQAVGCAALIPKGNGIFELSKMAVAPAVRGMGIGRKLVAHLIAEAKALGAVSL